MSGVFTVYHIMFDIATVSLYNIKDIVCLLPGLTDAGGVCSGEKVFIMIYRLEKKFGKYAIPNLMRYVTAVYILGFLVNILAPGFYSEWLMLDIDKLMKGQVWRLLTFLIQPVEYDTSSGEGLGILFMAISLYLYYFIGSTLEKLWGSFRFNVFYFSGILCNILVVVLIYLVTYIKIDIGISYPIPLDYLNMSMFLAFAVEFSEVKLLLFFIVPIKVKYIGIAMVGIYVYDILAIANVDLKTGLFMAVALCAALLNFIVFFLNTKKYRGKGTMKNLKRRFEYQTGVKKGNTEAEVVSNNQAGKRVITRHRCVVCGRTELDDPDLEFRFCSKCEGNYEYCMDHLYTHVHVVREKVQNDPADTDAEKTE